MFHNSRFNLFGTGKIQNIYTLTNKYAFNRWNEQKKRVTIFNEKELALTNPFDKMKSISTSNILELEEFFKNKDK